MTGTAGSRYAAAASILALGMLCLGLISPGFGQQTSAQDRDQQIRQAMDLTKAGNYDAALRILDDLYKRLPEDGLVVRALFDLLVEGGRYDRAEDVIRRYLSQREGDVKAKTDLAALYFKTDRREDGMALLRGIVEMAPEEPWPYDIGLNVLTGSKLDEEALTWISTARAAVGDSTLFARDAARIHSQAGRYARATREQLRAAIGSDKSTEVEAQRIIAMAGDDDARPGVIAGLLQVKGIDVFAPAVRRALWEVYLIDGDCQSALNELENVIAETKSAWHYCVALGRQALEAGCYDECHRAYALAARYATDKSKIPAFLMGQGECEVKGGLLEQALRTYDGIGSSYPNSQWSAKAAMARAGIYRQLGRLDQAAAEADRVIAEERAGDAKYEAILFKADCLVDIGRLDDAFETYDLVEDAWKPGHAQEAFFNMGEIRFYEGDFDGAESYYNVALRQFYDEPRANDAIERILLFKASKIGEVYVPELKDLAHAMLLRRQGKIEDARVIFDRLARGAGEIKVESLQNLSEMYLEQGAFERAAATYKVIGESLDTRRSPAALEAAGDIYLGLGRTDEAIRIYEDVILRFPDSVAAGEARRKIDYTKRRGSGES